VIQILVEMVDDAQTWRGKLCAPVNRGLEENNVKVS